jgi:hypothetical protein
MQNGSPSGFRLSTVASAYHLHSTQIVKFSGTTERGFAAELPGTPGTPERRTKDITRMSVRRPTADRSTPDS